ncbi:MAG: ferritin-like domain-containing protein [Thiohalocapsa sp.]
MAIRDLDSLRQHLQWAIQVEHATIPPYLFALYSIKEDRNREAAEILRSIFVEEMLHMTLAANLLNAVGGSPRLVEPDFLPEYPCNLPHSSRTFQVRLARFSPDTLRGLMRIERPESAGAAPEDDAYETIGQFYKAIEQGLLWLCAQLGEQKVFSGDPACQIEPQGAAYLGSGRIIPVLDKASALAALAEIMHQGEGLDHDAIWDGDRSMFHQERNEVGHFFRLQELLDARRFRPGDTPQSGPTGQQIAVDWDAVYRPGPDPDAGNDPTGSEAHILLQRFAREYSEILRFLERGLNGGGNQLARSVGAMYALKHTARELMQAPGTDAETSVGLGFAYQPPREPLHPFEGPMIRVRPDGPYAVQGNVPLWCKSILRSENGEALAWSVEGQVETPTDYALCRCGASKAKPFCDGSHAAIGFQSAETVGQQTPASRASYPGAGMVLEDDRPLCVHAGFCTNHVTDVWKLMDKTVEVQVRIQVIGMIEHCPSGALTYALTEYAQEPRTVHSETSRPLEPDLSLAIAIIPNGPLWVTGRITIQRTDGTPLEPRNRVTLCRCGQSKNKPLCDGSHLDSGFVG